MWCRCRWLLCCPELCLHVGGVGLCIFMHMCVYMCARCMYASNECVYRRYKWWYVCRSAVHGVYHHHPPTPKQHNPHQHTHTSRSFRGTAAGSRASHVRSCPTTALLSTMTLLNRSWSSEAECTMRWETCLDRISQMLWPWRASASASQPHGAPTSQAPGLPLYSTAQFISSADGCRSDIRPGRLTSRRRTAHTGTTATQFVLGARNQYPPFETRLPQQPSYTP